MKAVRAVVTLARPLRGEDAHGGRPGIRWLRLNFPTERGRWGEPRPSICPLYARSSCSCTLHRL